jgi:hypothetical protein
MEIVGENYEKRYILQKQGLFCYGSPRRRFVFCIARRASSWLAMASITGHDMNLRRGKSELTVASLAGQNLHNF